MKQAAWLALWPGLCLTIVVYRFNMLGDALRDLLDPRLRGGSNAAYWYRRAERDLPDDVEIASEIVALKAEVARG